MRPIDADAFKKYIDAQEGRPFIGCTVGEAMKILIDEQPTIQSEPQWIPVSERLPSKEERKEWIDNNLDGIGYLYPCLVTRYSSINPDRTKKQSIRGKTLF